MMYAANTRAPEYLITTYKYAKVSFLGTPTTLKYNVPKLPWQSTSWCGKPCYQETCEPAQHFTTYFRPC